MTCLKFASILILGTLAAPLLAQDEVPPADDQAGLEDLSAPPPLPPKIQDEQIEPTVEIRKEEDRTIEEYSLNGQVYMVKVTPEKGPAFYYMDHDGDGQLELQADDRTLNPVQPVYWKIKEWQ